jgi:hypothetical protein
VPRSRPLRPRYALDRQRRASRAVTVDVSPRELTAVELAGMRPGGVRSGLTPIDDYQSLDGPDTALHMPRGHIGSVGVPDGWPELSIQVRFSNNIGVDAGVVPVCTSTSQSWGPKDSTGGAEHVPQREG